MRHFTYLIPLTVALATSMFLAGCGSNASSAPAGQNSDHGHNHDDHDGHDHDGHDHDCHDHDGADHDGHSHDGANHDGHAHGHDHGDTGPHGGHLIELGRNGKYHAELVENDAEETVAIYILNAHMKELAIAERSIVLNLTTDGETAAYGMVAAGDGQSANHSRFESTDKALFRVLERGEISGKLRVTIEGVPYVGRISHHEHAHHDSTHQH